MESYSTLVDAINGLKTQGYTEDFNLKQNSIESANGNFKVFHNEFIIDKVYRFEGQSDPADEATVYAISSAKYSVKGVLVNGGGIYTEDVTDEMLETLKIKKQ